MRSIAWRNRPLRCPAIMAAAVSRKARRSQVEWKTGSSASTSTGPKPCIPPRSCTPSTGPSQHSARRSARRAAVRAASRSDGGLRQPGGTPAFVAGDVVPRGAWSGRCRPSRSGAVPGELVERERAGEAGGRRFDRPAGHVDGDLQRGVGGDGVEQGPAELGRRPAPAGAPAWCSCCGRCRRSAARRPPRSRSRPAPTRRARATSPCRSWARRRGPWPRRTRAC